MRKMVGTEHLDFGEAPGAIFYEILKEEIDKRKLVVNFC